MKSGRSRHPATFAALIVVLACGCASNKIIGRYKSAVCQTSGSEGVRCTSVIPTASAYAVSIRTPPASSLSGPVLPERVSSPVSDVRTIFHRTIVVTVRKQGGFNPADRLEATDVTIIPDKARFDSWDTLATDYTTIDAGTLQLTQVRGATESLSAGPPSGAPISASASVGASQTNTRVENLTASSQAETLSATVEDDGAALVIHRQGGYGVDLTGNTIIKVDMSYSGNPMSTYIFSAPNYVDARGKWLPANKVVLKATPISVVPPETAITAHVTLIYTIRHVKSGDATYEEKDDDVLELTSAPVTRTVILIPKREASPPTFGLWETAGPTKDFAVNVARPGRDPVGLCFDSYNEASDFPGIYESCERQKPQCGW